jgi:hypothetical protein
MVRMNIQHHPAIFLFTRCHVHRHVSQYIHVDPGCGSHCMDPKKLRVHFVDHQSTDKTMTMWPADGQEARGICGFSPCLGQFFGGKTWICFWYSYRNSEPQKLGNAAIQTIVHYVHWGFPKFPKIGLISGTGLPPKNSWPLQHGKQWWSITGLATLPETLDGYWGTEKTFCCLFHWGYLGI